MTYKCVSLNEKGEYILLNEKGERICEGEWTFDVETEPLKQELIGLIEDLEKKLKDLNEETNRKLETLLSSF